jgi:hypothetical protein
MILQAFLKVLQQTSSDIVREELLDTQLVGRLLQSDPGGQARDIRCDAVLIEGRLDHRQRGTAQVDSACIRGRLFLHLLTGATLDRYFKLVLRLYRTVRRLRYEGVELINTGII